MTPSPENTNALSDEQFCEMLLRGETAPGTEEAAFQQAVASYRKETLLWAERRSSAMPSLAPAARRSRVWECVPQWSLAAVAAITVAVGIAHYNNTLQQAAGANASTNGSMTISGNASGTSYAVLTQSTPEQIADDNALLNQIDAAVNAGSELRVDALGLHTARTSAVQDGSME